MPIVDEYFHDVELKAAVARALGIPVTTSYSGTPLVQEPIRASQMASLTRLDLSGLGIADVHGLEFATNLRVLSLSGNEVADLAVLTGHVIQDGEALGTPAGLTKLEYLALDFTQLANVDRLAEFTELKALTADGRPALQPLLSGGGLNSTLLRQIPNPTPATSDLFAFSMAAFGNVVVVGAVVDDTGATNAGAAYLFDLTSGQLLRTLNNPTPTLQDDFGYSVAISGDLVAVGAPFHDEAGIVDAGAVYVFDIRTGALLRTLLEPTRVLEDNFGLSIAMSGNNLLVGAPSHDRPGAPVPGGAAYLFDARTGLLLNTFKKASPVAGDNFGYSVAISETQALVGARLDDTSAANAGAAYLFDVAGSGVPTTILNPAPIGWGQLRKFGGIVGPASAHRGT